MTAKTAKAAKAAKAANGGASAARYGRIYSLLGFAGIYFLAGEFVVPLASGAGGLAAALALLALMGLGCGLQFLWSGVTGTKRAASSRGYEQDVKLYEFRKALPVAAVALAPSYLCARLTDSYLRWQGAQQGGFYDEGTALPALAFAGAFLIIMLGSFLWFFPYDRLLTGRAAFVGWTLSLIAFLIARNRGFGLSFMFVGYALCVMVSMNQSSLVRTYRGSASEFLTPRMRNTNLWLTLGLVPLFLAACLAVYVLLSGIKTLGLLILAALLRGTRGADTEYDDTDEALAHINRFVFNSEVPEKSPEFWYLIIFIAVVMLILFMIITRHTIDFRKLFRRISDWLTRLIREIIDSIRFFNGIKVSLDEDEGNVNYRDEETRLQETDIREYARRTDRERTYRDFQSELRDRRTAEEKYLFAYSELVRVLRRKGAGTVPSDTPREIAAKFAEKKRYGSDRIRELTEELERIGYAEMPAGPSSPERLDLICRIIKDVMT